MKEASANARATLLSALSRRASTSLRALSNTHAVGGSRWAEPDAAGDRGGRRRTWVATKAVISAVSYRSSERVTAVAAGGQHGWYIWMPSHTSWSGCIWPSPINPENAAYIATTAQRPWRALGSLSSRRPNSPRVACPRRPPRAHAEGDRPRPQPTRFTLPLSGLQPTVRSEQNVLRCDGPRWHVPLLLAVRLPASARAVPATALTVAPFYPKLPRVRCVGLGGGVGVARHVRCRLWKTYDGSLSTYDVVPSGTAVSPPSAIGLPATRRIM